MLTELSIVPDSQQKIEAYCFPSDKSGCLKIRKTVMGFKNIRMIIYEFKQVRVIFKFHRGFTWNIFIPNQMQMIY